MIKGLEERGKFKFFFVICFLLIIYSSAYPEDFSKQGIDFYHKGKYAEAIEQLRKAEKLHPRDPKIYYYLGLSLYRTKKYYAAISAFKKSLNYLEKDTEKATAFYYLGLSYFEAKEFGEALGAFESAERLNPALGLNVSYYKGLVFYSLGKGEDAGREFRKVQKSSPSSPLGISAGKYIKRIEQGKIPLPPRVLGGALGMRYAIDDNITYDPVKVAEGGDNKTTSFLRLIFYPQIRPFKNFSFNFNLYDYAYTKRKELGTNGYVVGVNFSGRPNRTAMLSLTYDFSFFRKEGANYYNTRYLEGRATFKLYPKARNWTIAYLGYLIGDYQQEDYKPLNYKENIFGVKQYLEEDLSLGLELSRSLVERDDYSYYSGEIQLNYKISLPSQMDLLISNYLLFKSFIYEDLIAGKKREDMRNTFRILISKELPYDMSAGLGLTNILNRSNLTRENSSLNYGDFLENIVEFSLAKRF